MLAIASGKGGVGKTTTALGLASALPGQPLVVDADSDMPNLHALAAVPRSLPGDNDDDGASHRLRTSSEHDCRVLPAPVGDTVRADKRLARIQTTLSDHQSEHDTPILVDTPAGAGIDATAPLRVADGVLLVSTACAPALRDTAKTASMARTVGTPVLGAILTRTRARPPNVSALFDCPVLSVVPPVSGRPLKHRQVRERYEAAATALRDRQTSI